MAGSLDVLVSETLQKAGFAHAFTTRIGGVSEPPYQATDFAILRDPEHLRENQRRLAATVGFAVGRLFQTKQVHGRAIVVAGGDPAARIEEEADALVAEPGSGDAVAVRVADCVPVLVADPDSGRVAAIHAGWRGEVAGVLEGTVEHLRRAPGAGPPAAYVAAIGPSIGPCCFEVGEDVAAEIERSASRGAWDARWGAVVARRDAARRKAYVDLRVAARRKLHAAGLSFANIDDVPGCTRCDAERFYSYRRDGDASGRLVGVIVADASRAT